MTQNKNEEELNGVGLAVLLELTCGYVLSLEM